MNRGSNHNLYGVGDLSLQHRMVGAPFRVYLSAEFSLRVIADRRLLCPNVRLSMWLLQMGMFDKAYARSTASAHVEHARLRSG
jgi:hypothetical protein